MTEELETLYKYGAINKAEYADGIKLISHIASDTNQGNRRVRNKRAFQNRLLETNSIVYTKWMFENYYTL